MRKLSLILGLVLFAFWGQAQQNPHGKTLKFDCVDCHTTEGWTFSPATSTFSHDSTSFKLEGQHRVTDCKSCHTTLVFSEAKTNCMDCHTDMHNNTLGLDCARCHDPKSWLVSNISEIHQQSGFPLLGAHNVADCVSCHTSASKLEFQPLGVECIDCHRQDFLATTSPNHVEAGFSTNCIDCHKIDAIQWSSTGFNHDFFPLTKGHEIADCAACHTNGVSETLSPDCISCHQQDFNSTTNPPHPNLDFSTTCTDCHTTDPGWKPARFETHDNLYFPIYSGAHRGEWDKCMDCHTQPETYTVFSCTDCHEHNKTSTDREHDEVSGYTYTSTSCYACHPTGRGEGAFNHDATGFPLKGAHIQAQCLDCHSNGYASTLNLCSSCHTDNYNLATNPNHVSAGIATECETCHTEEGWTPSIFNHTTTTRFELSGGHAGRQCVDCHQGTTSNASAECISCHQENYNQAENHVAQNYPLNCLQCHTTASWDAANFDHNATNFPLTGAHVATECAACHTNGYSGTSTTCISCHQTNFDGTANPNHNSIGIPTNCDECHTTNPGWQPATFPIHNDYYALNGAHATVANNCFLCHEGNYTNTSNTCYGCHSADYNNTTDPAHSVAQFPTDCQSCHSESAWTPSTFNHDGQYFPIYSGRHQGTWSSCATCHTEPTNYAVFSCITCHEHNKTETDSHHGEVRNYVYTSTSCYDCHPTGRAEDD